MVDTAIHDEIDVVVMVVDKYLHNIMMKISW